MSDEKYWPCEHIKKTQQGIFYLHRKNLSFVIEEWDICPFKECGAMRPKPKPRTETLDESIVRLANNAHCDRAMSRDAVDELYLKIISEVDDLRRDIKTFNEFLVRIKGTITMSQSWNKMPSTINWIRNLVDECMERAKNV